MVLVQYVLKRTLDNSAGVAVPFLHGGRTREQCRGKGRLHHIRQTLPPTSRVLSHPPQTSGGGNDGTLDGRVWRM